MKRLLSTVTLLLASLTVVVAGIAPAAADQSQGGAAISKKKKKKKRIKTTITASFDMSSDGLVLGVDAQVSATKGCVTSRRAKLFEEAGATDTLVAERQTPDEVEGDSTFVDFFFPTSGIPFPPPPGTQYYVQVAKRGGGKLICREGVSNTLTAP